MTMTCKQVKYYACVGVCWACLSLLISCVSSTAGASTATHSLRSSAGELVTTNRVYLDEDGNISDIRLGKVTPICGKSCEYTLGLLLNEARHQISGHDVDIALVLRDTRPCMTPEPAKVDANKLLELYTTPDDTRAKGSCYVEVSDMRLIDAINFVVGPQDWAVRVDPTTNRLSITVGSPELVYSESVRRVTFEIPNTNCSEFNRLALPCRLPVGGRRTTAYDPEHGVLVAIVDWDSRWPDIMRGLGVRNFAVPPPTNPPADGKR